MNLNRRFVRAALGLCSSQVFQAKRAAGFLVSQSVPVGQFSHRYVGISTRATSLYQPQLFSPSLRLLHSKASADNDNDGTDINTVADDADVSQTAESDARFATTYHAPVMWKECIDALLQCERSRIRQGSEYPNADSAVDDNEDVDVDAKDARLVFVDGTLGGGGHSNALLETLQAGDIVLGCDVDPDALATASERLHQYTTGDETKPHFIPVRTNFGDLPITLKDVAHPVTNKPVLEHDTGVDGILLDLGVSSHQIDTAERGFAFMKDGPLDMRMSNQSSGLTAADICNEFDTRELQRILKVYGDEPRSKVIANAIAEHRPLSTTGDLVDAVATVTPQFAKKSKRMGRTATLARVFQSLRIVVNNEEKVLEQVLSEACPKLLRPGGRLVVLSYHSMEDRATKRMIRDGTIQRNKRSQQKDMYGNYNGPPKPFKVVGKRGKARKDEIEINTRARSATLRVGERTTSEV